MPKFLKHVGQAVATGKKCVVVFRTIPGDANSCLVVETESLATAYHDTLVEAVESAAGQDDVDFYKVAQRLTFHDGRNMLEAMHLSGWLRKFPTEQIIMMPTPELKIGLRDLNSQLDQVDAGRTTSGDINRDGSVPEGKPAGVLDDADIANQMRNQASFFRSEADRLLKEAEALAPSSTANVQTAEDAPRAKRAYNRKK
jgi:hypothetical protein